MRGKMRILSAVTAAALMMSAVPATANAEYRGPDTLQQPPTGESIIIDHHGFYGEGNTLTMPYIRGDYKAVERGWLYVPNRDKYYVRITGVEEAAESFGSEFVKIFGEGAEFAVESKEEVGYVVLAPGENAEYSGVYDVPMYDMKLCITDPDITYSEYLAANEYCKVHDADDYYYGPERTEVWSVPLWCTNFSGAVAYDAEVTAIETALKNSGLDNRWSYDVPVNNGVTGSASGYIILPEDAMPDVIFEAIVKIQDESGVKFYGNFEPEFTEYVSYQTIDESYFVGKKRYTYNELAAMTDDEVRALFPDYFANEYDGAPYDASCFGDESMSDIEKFRQFFCFGTENENYCGGMVFDRDEMPVNWDYYYIEYYVDYKYDLEDGFTAEDFGYPADWEFTTDRGYFTNDSYNQYSGDRDWLYIMANQYKVKVPAEVACDFESYIRLTLCTKECPAKNVSYVNGPELFFAEIAYEPIKPVYHGDVNEDDNVNLADVVRIMQANANPGEYALTSVYQRRVADVDGSAGYTNNDALRLQLREAGLLNRKDLIPAAGVRVVDITADNAEQ